MTVFLKSVEGGGGVADVNGFIVMKRLREKKKIIFKEALNTLISNGSVEYKS